MMNLKEVNDEMSALQEWSLEGDSIVKIFNFTNFREALDFVNKTGEIAEKNNHHPDILMTYNSVRLQLTTHTVHSLTKKDFEVAREIDSL